MTGITSRLKIFALKKIFNWKWIDFGLIKIKKPAAGAECHQIQKMGQIIYFFVNTHVLKSESGYGRYFTIFFPNLSIDQGKWTLLVWKVSTLESTYYIPNLSWMINTSHTNLLRNYLGR